MGAEAVTAADVPVTDRELARRVGDGDAKALESLYHRHVDRVHGLCLRLTADRRAAEELTQDVWVRVWRRAGGYRGEAAFTTWLHRVTSNLVKDRRRHRARRGQHERLMAVPEGGSDARGPEDVEDRIALERAILELPQKAREVFVLHDVEGYRHRDVAEMLGIAVGTSKSHLFRARRLLRETLGSEGDGIDE